MSNVLTTKDTKNTKRKEQKMREILFRGKNKKNGEWVYCYLINFEERTYILEQNYQLWDILEAGDEIDAETVGQYIGLKDCNGDRIFEGDIVERERQVGTVVYDPAVYRLLNKEGDFITDGYPDWDNYIVIGNIYDNPELLEEK